MNNQKIKSVYHSLLFTLHILLIGFCLILTGCATTEYPVLPEPSKPTLETPKPEGIYHKVQKGQTLWRISKTYGVAVEEIISANNIPNAAAIEIGQLLLIPGAKQVQDIPVLSQVQEDANKDEFAWPVKGKILSYFKDRKGEGVNRGVDIETNEGDIVRASREGQIVFADYMSGYNQTVMIDHGDGFISVYAQNSKLLVKLGNRVYKGDPIAETGSVAGLSFLHFEIRKAKESTNPLYYLP